MEVSSHLFLNEQISKPHPSLVRAIRFCPYRDLAVEIGCGNFNDAKYLQKTFKRLCVVESSPKVASNAERLKTDNVEIYQQGVEDYKFPQNVSLINAHRVLHYIHKDRFENVMNDILNALSKRGVFVGTFVGERDSWVSEDLNGSYPNEEVLKRIFQNFDFKIESVESDGKNVQGDEKHWHVYRVIAKKK